MVFLEIAVQVNESLTNTCSLLRQTLNHTRRCVEGFKSKYLQWLQIRRKIDDNFSFLQEILLFNESDKYGDGFRCSVQLSEILLQDADIVQDLYTIFNEYLNYIAKIEEIFNNVSTISIGESIISLTIELPEFYQTLILAEKQNYGKELFQLIPILRHLNLLSSGKLIILREMLDHLTYLSFHWDIIGTLNELERQKDERNEIDTFQDMLPNEEDAGKRVSYRDLVSTLSTSSTACGYIEKVLNFTKEEIEGQADSICTKLARIQSAINVTTRKIGQLTELLISET